MQEERSKNEVPNIMFGPNGEVQGVGYVPGQGLDDQANICLIHPHEGIFYLV